MFTVVRHHPAWYRVKSRIRQTHPANMYVHCVSEPCPTDPTQPGNIGYIMQQ